MENLKANMLEMEGYLKLLHNSYLEKMATVEAKLQAVSKQVKENKRKINKLESRSRNSQVKEEVKNVVSTLVLLKALEKLI
jgi:hypothetical protein